MSTNIHDVYMDAKYTFFKFSVDNDNFNKKYLNYLTVFSPYLTIQLPRILHLMSEITNVRQWIISRYCILLQ